MTAVDYAGARFSPAQLRGAGVVAVGRYLTGTYGTTPSEVAELIGAGIVMWFVFENLSTDATTGFTIGAAHAQQANAALGHLGLPNYQPVYFAADQELLNPAAALPYFEGIASIRPPATNGDYGEGALCQLLADRGLTAFHWQSMSTSFPGNGAALPITAIHQKATGAPLAGTDLDILMKADIGQYPRPAPPAPPAPPPPTVVPVGALMRHDISIPTDGNGDGWVQTAIPWSTYQAVSIGGANPPANGYWPGQVLVQENNGNVLVTVVGTGRPNNTVEVNVLASA